MTTPNDPQDHRPEPAAPDSSDERTTPRPDQDGHPDTAGEETPGDLGAGDIVGPVGEEMPVQTHDEVDRS